MRYNYLLEVHFENSTKLEKSIERDIYYIMDYCDKLLIEKDKLTISFKRNKKKDIKTTLLNFNSTFNKQLNKSLTFLAVVEGYIPTIKLIQLSSYNSRGEITQTHAIDKINQPLNKSLHKNSLWTLEEAKILLEDNSLSHSLLLATVYWLKANDDVLEGHKFEKHWKSFNTLYTLISNKKTEFDKLVFIKKFICSNPSLFSETINYVGNFTEQDIRKLRIREMILNDYSTINQTNAYADFICRYKDYRINQLFKVTLPYRKDFLISKGLYNDVQESINTALSQNKKIDVEIITFYLIKYSYFIRNKYFHAEKIDSTFYLIPNAEIRELSLLNELFSIFLKELLISYKNYPS